jgi:hypothetical protein
MGGKKKHSPFCEPDGVGMREEGRSMVCLGFDLLMSDWRHAVERLCTTARPLPSASPPPLFRLSKAAGNNPPTINPDQCVQSLLVRHISIDVDALANLARLSWMGGRFGGISQDAANLSAAMKPLLLVCIRRMCNSAVCAMRNAATVSTTTEKQFLSSSVRLRVCVMHTEVKL